MSYAPDSNRPYTHETPLGAIFVGIKPEWAQFPAGRVRELPGSHPILGFVYMACAKEQQMFLMCVWEGFYADDDIVATCQSFIKQGWLHKIIDWQDAGARERFMIAYNAVCTARGRV